MYYVVCTSGSSDSITGSLCSDCDSTRTCTGTVVLPGSTTDTASAHGEVRRV
jgi:hypothetical protein